MNNNPFFYPQNIEGSLKNMMYPPELNPINNIASRINKLEEEVARLKEKVNNLETPNINKYNGDDNVYML